MPWPDKVGIGVASLIVAVALYGLVVLLNGLPPTAPFEFQDWTRFGTALVKTLFFVALPIWLAARLQISLWVVLPNVKLKNFNPRGMSRAGQPAVKTQFGPGRLGRCRITRFSSTTPWKPPHLMDRPSAVGVRNGFVKAHFRQRYCVSCRSARDGKNGNRLRLRNSRPITDASQCARLNVRGRAQSKNGTRDSASGV